MPSQRPLVIAHRGASGYRPEHSEAAYRLGLRLGADAVEPDIVASRDGVLVLRHENEISGTTDVASRPEFAHLRTTKSVDGTRLTGWFTEDFTWDQLATLRVRERLAPLRRLSASFDGRQGILRLSDLLDILDDEAERRGEHPILTAEIKHSHYFDSLGLQLEERFAAEVAGRMPADALVVESFEQTALDRLRDAGVPGRRVFLVERAGAPADLVARHGSSARSYADHVTPEGLAALAAAGVHGASVDVALILDSTTERGVTDIVDRIHSAGLDAFAWTLRPGNRFLARGFRRGSSRDYGDWQGQFALLLSTGLDGVFADHPDLVLDLLGDRG